MTTEAVTSKDAKLYVNTAASGDAVWTQIKEMKTYPNIGEGNMQRLDATHLESSTKEYIKDIPDMPDLEFTFNAMPGDATNSNLALLRDTLDPTKAYEFKLEIPLLKTQMRITADWSYNITNGGVSQIPEISLQLAGRTAMVMEAIPTQVSSP
ncbi:MAG: hypothetical protein IJT54_03920 [Candidatus Methanomethylophilaceae archaeon]|nr:hypothetical protein [Candidatus Methanomethylophilaceae archaeon]